MLTSSHITAAEVQHQQKLRGERRVCERQNANGTSTNRERDSELEKLSMMRFDSATSSHVSN